MDSHPLTIIVHASVIPLEDEEKSNKYGQVIHNTREVLYLAIKPLLTTITKTFTIACVLHSTWRYICRNNNKILTADSNVSGDGAGCS